MKTKHIVLTVLIAFLLSIATIQTLRIERYKVNYAGLEVEFATFREGITQAVLDDREQTEKRYREDRKKTDETIAELQNKVASRDADVDHLDGLLNQANARLYQARQSANRNSCEEAGKALNLCTELHRELEQRIKADESRIGILTQYADRLEIELDACERVNSVARN